MQALAIGPLRHGFVAHNSFCQCIEFHIQYMMANIVMHKQLTNNHSLVFRI